MDRRRMVGEMSSTQAFLPREPMHGGSDAANEDPQTPLKHCHNNRPIFVQLLLRGGFRDVGNQ